MTYTALARKWRPRSFQEMSGQEHVLRALGNALSQGRVHHAFLFTGTRGVGKTTIARIFAKCLNCDTGVTATPCGECASCREIDTGRFVDLIEVDAASRTKVEDTRELLENVQYLPTRGRYKVYLIDEVHMLTTHSFNALLKTLEEPPPHVKFLLATTDPQKLPVTVLSRCLQFNLKRLPVATIVARLEHILAAEKIPYDAAALRLVAVAADGSLRDALSLLDQLLAYGDGEARDTAARAMLGTVDRQQVVGLAQRLAENDAPGLLQYALGLEAFTPDYAQLLDELNSLFTQVALRQVVPDLTDESSDHPPELLSDLAARIGREDLQLYYQIGVTGRRDLVLAPDPREGFAMTLLRMLAFRPVAASAGGTAPAGPGGGGGGGPGGGGAGQGVSAARAAARAATSPAGRPQPSAAPAASGAAASPAIAAPAAAAPPAASASAPAGTPPEIAPTPANWSAIVARLELGGLARQLAANCQFVAHEPGVVRLALDQRSQSIRSRTQEDRLAQALSRYLGETVRVEIELGQGPVDTPAREQLRQADERLVAARASLAADPAVLALQERFDGVLLPDSVRLPAASSAAGRPPLRTEEG